MYRKLRLSSCFLNMIAQIRIFDYSQKLHDNRLIETVGVLKFTLNLN